MFSEGSSSTASIPENPNTRILISPSSSKMLRTDTNFSPKKQHYGSTLKLSSTPSRTSISFFKGSDSPGPFEPMRLRDISSVLNAGDKDENNRPTKKNFSTENVIPSDLISKNENAHSRYQTSKKFQFILNLLNGLIGVCLMLLSFLLLVKVGNAFSYPFFEYQKGEAISFFMELIRWSAFLLWNFGSYLAISALFDIIPKILIEFTSLGEYDKFCDELTHITRLRSLFISFGVALIALCLANGIFCERLYESNATDTATHFRVIITWQFIIRRTLISIACLLGVVTLEQWFIQRVSIAFHRLYYRDRIRVNNSKMGIIMALKKFAINRTSLPLSQALSGLFAHITGITSEYLPSNEITPASISTIENYDQDHYHEEAILLATEISLALHQNVKNEKGSIESSIGYENGSPVDSSLHLTKEDFNAVFENEDDVTEAYNLLDEDGNGDISIDEMANCIISTFKDRSSILKSLVENKSIIIQLDRLVLSLLSVLLFALILQIFDLPTSSIAAFGTIFFGLSFVFGKLASTLLSSVVFIFISHPYDVGDHVSFDSFNEITVHEMGLLSTTFIAKDGRLLYIQNSDLFQKFIYNIRRSLPQTETFSLTFEIEDSKELIENLCLLKETLLEFIENNNRDYFVIENWFKTSLEAKSSLAVDIVLAHRSNFQDSDLKQIRSEKFSIFLMNQLQELGLN